MTREVLLVCGPPSAGKSTYARSSGAPLVVDFDDLVARFGSNARKARDLLERQVAFLRAGCAVVIRSAPDGGPRELMAARLRARVLVIDPGRDEVIRRAAAADRPAETFDAIDQWYRRFTASPVDEYVR